MTFRHASPDHFIDVFRTYYGSVHKAFLALDPAGQLALEGELRNLIARFDRETDGSMRVPSEFAKVIVTRT